MRKIFVDKILEIMQADEDIIFLTGDLGFGSFEIIAEFFPERFYNMGIAEQNMIGTACGLSLSGKKVIIYSIANFATLRVVEQIRNYLIYHQNKVLIVNGGGGFCYGQLGYTHHAVEDISIMKTLPCIRIFAPCEDKGIRYGIDQWLAGNQTCYLRLEKSGLTQLDELQDICYTDYGIRIGKDDACNFILGYGTVVGEAIEARQQLSVLGIDVTIIILVELKYISEQILNRLNNTQKVVFIEENSEHGGMGEHLLAQCMLHNIKIDNTYLLGVKDYISDTIGDQGYLRKVHKLDAKSIIRCFGDTFA